MLVVALAGVIGFSAHTTPVQTVVKESVGALTGPDISSPYLSVANVRTEFRRQNLATATTTICSIQSPSATSTLQGFQLEISTGTGTAATIDIGSHTTAFATTTSLYVGSYSVGSGATADIAVTPTTATTTVFAPNTYINAKTNGAGLGGYTYGGTCQAVFRTF